MCVDECLFYKCIVCLLPFFDQVSTLHTSSLHRLALSFLVTASFVLLISYLFSDRTTVCGVSEILVLGLVPGVMLVSSIVLTAGIFALL